MLDQDKIYADRNKTKAALFKARDFKGIIRFCRSELRYDQRDWVRSELLGFAYIAATRLQDDSMMESLLWQLIQLGQVHHRYDFVFNYIDLAKMLLLRQKKRPALNVLSLGLDLAVKEKEMVLSVLFVIYTHRLEALEPKRQSRYKKAFYQVLEDWDITLPDNMSTINLESITYAKKECDLLYCKLSAVVL